MAFLNVILQTLQWPHWLMIVGGLLVVIGFIGLAFKTKKKDSPKSPRTAVMVDQRDAVQEVQ